MTTREKAPTILTAEGARRLTARIRDALALADDLLVRAYEGRAWEALGHGSWEAYCAAELPELRHLKLRKAARQERAQALRDAGATIPEIVAATGSSLGTIHRDLNPPAFQMETAERPVTAASALTNWQVVARFVAARGAAGATCLELEDKLGWRHGAASGAFNSAEKKGSVQRDGRFRDGYGVYVSL